MSTIETDRAALGELQVVAREHERGKALVRKLHEGFKEILRERGERRFKSKNPLIWPLEMGLGVDPRFVFCEGKVGKELPMPFYIKSTGRNLDKNSIVVNVGQTIEDNEQVNLCFESDGDVHYIHPDRYGFYDMLHRQRPTIDELKPYEAMLGFIREELGIEDQ